MERDISNPHKSSGSTSESPEETEKNTIYETVPFSPITHNVDGCFIIADENHIYETLDERYHQFHATTDEHGRTEHPFHVGDFSPSWIDGDEEYEVGFYGTSTGLGHLNEEGEVSVLDDYRLRLFDDVDEKKDAKIPAKCTLIIEPRSSDLVNLKGDSFSYPKSADGKRYEGTYIKVSSSFAQDGKELLSWIGEWFEYLDAEWGTDLADHFEPIRETFYVSGLERHVRFHIDALERAVFAGDNTKRLCHTGDERESRRAEDIIENGRFKIFQFSTTELDELGFEEGPHDDKGRVAVKSDKVKIYRDINARRYGPDNYRHHPKFETRINEGKFHVSEWDDLVARADSILLTHLNYADITEEDLVSDDFFRPVDEDVELVEEHPTRQPTEYARPTGRMAALRDYWRSDETRRSLEGLVFHSETESYRDILIALNYKYSGAVTYKQLMEATGLSYSGVRRAVRKLVEASVLTRLRDAITLVDWANQFAYEKGRAWLREHLDPRESLVEMAARAVDRKLYREKLNSSSSVETDEEVDEEEETQQKECSTTEDEGDAELPSGCEGLTPGELREIEQRMESEEFSTFVSGTLMADGGAD